MHTVVSGLNVKLTTQNTDILVAVQRIIRAIDYKFTAIDCQSAV